MCGIAGFCDFNKRSSRKQAMQIAGVLAHQKEWRLEGKNISFNLIWMALAYQMWHERWME